MLRFVMKSKIHRATVTERNLAYSGSLTIDANLMEQADLIPNEKIQVVNINTGVRFETYTIRGEAGSGIIGVNGGAARLAEAGDKGRAGQCRQIADVTQAHAVQSLEHGRRQAQPGHRQRIQRPVRGSRRDDPRVGETGGGPGRSRGQNPFRKHHG